MNFFILPEVLKQRDPLSPALFIITAEVLFKALNNLFENNEFKGFGIPKWSDRLNHLAYADDIKIFVTAEKKSLQLIMEVLTSYENQSEQKINKEKSFFYMYSKAALSDVQLVERCTGFSRGTFSLIYLGCPISHVKKRKVHVADSIKKIQNKLHVWEGKILSFGENQY